MKRLILMVLFLLVPLSMAEGQSSGQRTSLLVANCKGGESTCDTQELVSYHFENGEYVAKDLVLSSATDQVRYDLGNNVIFRKRYVITNSGDIVDVTERKLIHKGDGEFAGIEGDRIIARVNRTGVHGIFAFDLSTSHYGKIKKPNIWEFVGTLSPDQRKAAHFELIWRKNNSPTTAIVIEGLGTKRVLRTKLSAECSVRCSSAFTVPLIWIDNSKILTQRSNGDLVVLHLDGKARPLFKIESGESPDSQPYFSRSRDGRINYSLNGKTYLLNIDAGTFEVDRVTLGNGFQVSRGDEFWETLYFEGEGVGKLWGGGGHATRDFVAFHYAEPGTNLGYPKGIKVWSGTKRSWTTIDINWGAVIIGWVDA